MDCQDSGRESIYHASKDKLFYDPEYAPDTNKVAAKKLTVPFVVLTGHSTASAERPCS